MRKSRTLAINALLATLTVIFTFIPLMPIGVSIAALMLLPVLIASQIETWRSALFAGAFLGVMRLIASFVIPTPTAAAFHNPMVSVFPRIFIGLVAWLVYRGVSKLMKNKKPMIAHGVASCLSAIAGVITNTGLVLSMIAAFYFGKTVGETAITSEFMMGLISVNFVTEVIVCALLTPPLAYAVKKSLNRGRIIQMPKIEGVDNLSIDKSINKMDSSGDAVDTGCDISNLPIINQQHSNNGCDSLTKKDGEKR